LSVDWIEKQSISEHAFCYGVMLRILVMLERWLRTQKPGPTVT